MDKAVLATEELDYHPSHHGRPRHAYSPRVPGSEKLSPRTRVSLAMLESKDGMDVPAQAASCQPSEDSGQVLGMVPCRGALHSGDHHSSLPVPSCHG